MQSRADGHSGSRSDRCLGLAAVLSLGLLLLSFARIFGDLNSAAGQVAVLESAIDAPAWKTRLALNVFLFTAALTSLHLAFGLACWFLAIASGKAFLTVRLTRREWMLLWFVAWSCWLLLANAALYPHSSLGEPYQTWVGSASAAGIPFHHILAVALGALALYTLILAAWRAGPPARRALALSIAGVSLIAGSGFASRADPPETSDLDRPNIIILGIDSLRGDVVDKVRTPAIHSFLGNSARFEDAITPLARTFPSWVTILTGREPHTTGALMNLLPRELIHTGATLPQVLRDHGYRTTYATDETRFSNVDSSYGFDHVIAPPMGGSDFVLSLAADTPLSNLVMNTRIGELLFPHIHANRAAHFTYDPDGFVERIQRNAQADAPAMLVAHLTLPHYPYTWARSRAATGNDRLARGNYLEAVSRVDAQFSDLMEMLDKRGFLKNAIVVLLSDHGEAIGHEDDLIAGGIPTAGPETEYQRWGHGTSVFSPSQYRVVLGFRGFGPARQLLPEPQPVFAPVSLVDVAPTLLELVGLDSPDPQDGSSLVPLLRGEVGRDFWNRIRFTETEFNPSGFTSQHPTPSAVAAAASVYRLDPASDRIEVREEKLDWILANRQFAAILGKRAIGAAVPSGTPGSHRFVYLPIEGTMSQEEAGVLRRALQAHYSISLIDPQYR